MPETVKLISAEGFEFIIDYEAACISNTIKNMLSSEGERGAIRLEEQRSEVGVGLYYCAISGAHKGLN